MRFIEGELYEGEVGSFGGEAPRQRWFVIAPFGKLSIQSIDDPLDLHYMPLSVARDAIASGRLVALGPCKDHPVLALQRAKEARNIVDTHMGRCGDNLERMLALLQDAMASGANYAQYAAGEIFAMLRGVRHTGSDITHTEREVWLMLHAAQRAGQNTAPRVGTSL